MIWYLLYLFRGTTEPPRLAHDHPIRKAFFHHGTAAARHWLLWITFSVAIAVLLCYPVFFIYENTTAGFASPPHHVWTSARLFDGSEDIRPDVEMRQVWVHGSYMRALDRSVLLDALDIQDALVGQELGQVPAKDAGIAEGEGNAESKPLQKHRSALNQGCFMPSAGNVSWGFHSPLMFWNCSAQSIEADRSVPNTINGQSHRKSFLNFTLRPASVFAGKSFVRNKLVAADAVVITMFDRLGLGIGEEWDQRTKALAENSAGRWTFYPNDGKVARDQFYEFWFQHMSLRDDFLLTAAYSLMALYVFISLRKLRAVKSKAGLALTIFVKIAVIMMSSFTICGLLRIDLARIPREAYPFVVLVMGLENMFRLINAVLSIPPEMPTTLKIGHALGDVGHLSLAAACQNLLLLWLLSKVVSPGVVAFCAYAAVAVVLDYLFHLTFFVAVLSVDVRRMELQDSLERVDIARANRRFQKQERQSWSDLLVRLPFSTRMAGSAATISFILTLNWHFFDSDGQTVSFSQVLRSAFSSGGKPSNGSNFSPPPHINQARTPAAWLRMQEHHTAEEVLHFIKPHGHSFIARVFDPLIVVQANADRSGAAMRTRLARVREVIDEHLFPFMLTLIFTIALVTLLMNYLLSGELVEDEATPEDKAEPALTIHTLPRTHTLDVVKLAACPRGHITTIGLDCQTSVSWLDPQTSQYSHSVLRTKLMSSALWPIVALTIDDTGSWLAFCSEDGKVAFWNLKNRSPAHFTTVDLGSQVPLTFNIIPWQPNEPDSLHLFILRPDGCLVEVDFLHSSPTEYIQLSDQHLCQAQIASTQAGPKIFAITKTGRLLIATSPNLSGDWSIATVDSTWESKPNGRGSRVRTVVCEPSLRVFAAVRSTEVTIFHLITHTLIHTIPTRKIKAPSFRIMSSTRRPCPSCGGIAVHSLSLAYTDADTHYCNMHTFTAGEHYNSLICLRPPSQEGAHGCRGFEGITPSLHRVENTGVWEATGMQSLIGVRKHSSTPAANHNTTSGSDYEHPSRSTGKSSLLSPRRRAARTKQARSAADETDEWEAWTLSSNGELATMPLSNEFSSQPSGAEQLYVSSPGPIARLGKRSVAVALGNRVKLILLPNERFQEDRDEFHELAASALQWRRRGSRR